MKNLIEILERLPEGTKIYNAITGHMATFNIVQDSIMLDHFYFSNQGMLISGDNNKDGECMIYPSKGHRRWDDWRKFYHLDELWSDNKDIVGGGFCFGYFDSTVYQVEGEHLNDKANMNIFATEKQAKAALAMARISQIMFNDPQFGGIITDIEWEKHHNSAIVRVKNKLEVRKSCYEYEFLSFHTEEQAKKFLANYEALIKQYYMMN